MKVAVVLVAIGLCARAELSGWHVSTNAGASTLTISHDALGVVLKDVRLNVRTARGLVPSRGWAVQAAGGRWTIRAASPKTGWRIEANGQMLAITATSTESVLTATVPAGPDRMVVRLLDREGTPVEWKGTDEVKSGYGGTETINRSYLPTHNPDVSFFSLGQIAGAEFHAIFDRKTDGAIDFGPYASLKRSARDENLLDLLLPFRGSTTIRVYPEYFTKTLGVPYYVPFDDSVFHRAPMVWSSWTSYYEAVTERDIIRNADWLSANLKPYGFEYVQLDDGYDRGPHGEHYWSRTGTKRNFLTALSG